MAAGESTRREDVTGVEWWCDGVRWGEVRQDEMRR